MTEERVGILGGTFDPIHLGHLLIAAEVWRQLGLREVLFMPAGQPWLKGQKLVSSVEHRLQMVELAVASDPRFKVSTIELERPGPTYSIETIRELDDKIDVGGRLFLILGFDTLTELPRWKEPERLVEICQVVVVGRPGYSEFSLHTIDDLIPGASERIMMIDMPQIDISASDIRERVSRGLSIRHLVPGAVEEYILKHGLYLEGGSGN